MGRHKTRAHSDTSEDSSGSEYGRNAINRTIPHRRHETTANTVSSKLRPRSTRKNIVYQDLDSELDDFLESDEEDEEESGGKGSLENLPVVLFNTIEKFLLRRIKEPRHIDTEIIQNASTTHSKIKQSKIVLNDTSNELIVSSENKDILVDELNDISTVNNLNHNTDESENISQCSTIDIPMVLPPQLDIQTPSDTSGCISDITTNSTVINDLKQNEHHELFISCADIIAPSEVKEETPCIETIITATDIMGGHAIQTDTVRCHDDSICEYEYLIKYHHVSYLHCEWLSEKEIIAAITTDRPLRTRFNNFIKKIEAGIEIPEVNLIDAIPERIVDCSDPFRALYPTKAAEVARSDWTMYCLKILDAIVCFGRDYRYYGVPFLRPVDEDKDGAPGYYNVVKIPMDFGTVQTKLYLRQYNSPQEFWSDVKLIFSNCLEYNAPRTEISTQCRVLEALFDKLYHEWARMSRENKELESQIILELDYIPTSTQHLTIAQVIQHVSFKKQLQNPDRSILYCVKWKNRSYTEMSWELSSNISDKMKIAQYHRHVRVPEYVVGARGPGFWELDLQRRMLQETLLHCKAAKEYLYGNMAVSIQSLPSLSSGGTSQVTKERWSFNTGNVRDTTSTLPPRHQYPRFSSNHIGTGSHSGVPMTAAAAAGVAADNEQCAAMLRRNALMVGSSSGSGPSSLMSSASASHHGHLTGLSMPGVGGLVPAFLDQQHLSYQSELFTNPALAAAFAARFGRYAPVPSPAQRLISTTGGGNPPQLIPSQLNQNILSSAYSMNPTGGNHMFSQGVPNMSGQSISHFPSRSHFLQGNNMHQHLIPQVAFPTPAGLNFRQYIPNQSAQASYLPAHHQQQQQQCPPMPHSSIIGTPDQRTTLTGPISSVSINDTSLNNKTTGDHQLDQSQKHTFVDQTTTHSHIPSEMMDSVKTTTTNMCEGVTTESSIVLQNKTELFYVLWDKHLLNTPTLYNLLPLNLSNRLIVPIPLSSHHVGIIETTTDNDILGQSLHSILTCCEGVVDPVNQVSDPHIVDTDYEIELSLPTHNTHSSGMNNNNMSEITSMSSSPPCNLLNDNQTHDNQPVLNGITIDSIAPIICKELKIESITDTHIIADSNTQNLSNKLDCIMNHSAISTTTVPLISDSISTTVPSLDVNQILDERLINNTHESTTVIKDPSKNVPVPGHLNEETPLNSTLHISPVPPIPPVIVSPPVIDRTRPATFAATSIYAEQFCTMKKPKPPPSGVSRHYPVSSSYKGNRKLFDYQLDGLNWLLDLWENGNNGILADEMGLGKTVQSMAFLWHLFTKERIRGPFLVVAPLSTLDHWKRTAEDWTDMNVILYYDENGRAGRDALRRAEWYHSMVDLGHKRTSTGASNKTDIVNPRIISTYHYKFHLLLTSYEIFASDAELLVPIPWQFVVVDEAHRLKNRLSKTLQLLKQVACRFTLLLTGTPVQNNTEELWPLLNYIEPVRFCDVDAFKMEFGELQTNEQVTKLTELLRPHLLRRVKEDVAESIPPLEETIIDVELTILQKAYYKAIFEKNKNFLFKNAKKGQQLPSLMNVEMELRKCCNHPFMIHGVEQREYSTCKTEAEKFKKLTESSGKLVLLDKLLPKLKTENHKVLIFSQFQQTLSIIQEFIVYKGWEYERLDGQVKGTDRSSAIARFNEPGSSKFVFLLSTRAGGLGINLTSADTVIIFDSDWNPQNDIQATARAHRIGQEREVKVYRLVTARTYEADMFDRASKKLGLNTAVFHRGAFDSKSRNSTGIDKTNKDDPQSGTLSSSKAPSKEEIEDLLKKGAFYLLENNGDAAREFQENNIEEILSRNSRLVRYQLTGMRSTFAKTSFKSDKASDLSFDDPDFWQKVLNDSSSRRLLARLNDGSATATDESMETFMSDLQAAVEGIAAEDDPEPVIEALVQCSNLTIFNQKQREKAEEWLARVNSNLEALHETTGAGSSSTVNRNSSPGPASETDGAGGGSTSGIAEDDDSRAGLRRSARVSKMDPGSYVSNEDKLYWVMAAEERDRRRAARRARRSDTASDADDNDDEDNSVSGATPRGTSNELQRLERKLFNKFAQNSESRILYNASLEDVLSESPSGPDEDDDEDEEDDAIRSPLRGRKRKNGRGRGKVKDISGNPVTPTQRTKRKTKAIIKTKQEDDIQTPMSDNCSNAIIDSSFQVTSSGVKKPPRKPRVSTTPRKKQIKVIEGEDLSSSTTITNVTNISLLSNSSVKKRRSEGITKQPKKLKQSPVSTGGDTTSALNEFVTTRPPILLPGPSLTVFPSSIDQNISNPQLPNNTISVSSEPVTTAHYLSTEENIECEVSNEDIKTCLSDSLPISSKAVTVVDTDNVNEFNVAA